MKFIRCSTHGICNKHSQNAWWDLDAHYLFCGSVKFARERKEEPVTRSTHRERKPGARGLLGKIFMKAGFQFQNSLHASGLKLSTKEDFRASSFASSLGLKRKELAA